MKFTLLTHELDLTSFNADFLLPIYEKFFNIEYFDESKTYDKQSTIIVNGLFRNSSWSEEFDGFKFIVDNLAELKQGTDSDHKLYLTCDKWFWYSESLWYLYLNYEKYVPKRTYKKLALMPMRLSKPNRNMLYDAVMPFLDDFIYSYVSKGITLPDDVIENGDVFQRNFNCSWYDNTCFSLVSESMITSNKMFVTEKTFKTFAHSHPFMVFGIPGTLNFLQTLGFETFSNMFDETYDSIDNNTTRLNAIVDNIKNFVKAPYDNLTLEKIAYNKNLFYNKELIEKKIVKEIIEPILEYAET